MSKKQNHASLMSLFDQPEQAALAVRGGAGERRQRAAPQEAASADARSAEDAQAESRLGAGGAQAAAGPAEEAAGHP